VLGALEGDRARFLPMLEPFRAMVDTQIAFATSSHRSRRVRFPRERTPSDPRDRLPALLRERARDLVCVHAEANAWPYGAGERATCPEELVHWVARRLATGESFEAVVAPQHALCAKTPWHLGVAGDVIARGVTRATLLERWTDFARPSDVVCTWGTHGATLFEAAGGVLGPARVDLRRAARSYANVAVGTMDAFGARLGVEPSPPCAAGRAGARLATLSAIASFLAA
jgi:hypothetical protein